ncbi:hypothetical protein HYH03_018310 [Edaphochlamys debaryana]|uniref:Uncharacterized protein n=1 Tax=Edaphochlamys debaryana TaxID=47281 RepID=A0A836BN86_9CHLO|nr:hypothetical protein HYH03_018310 [Edaphochlamys debaryana]|eukprot:KAG2482770.1 hypothetical protein HYH03_018310 [Edaphochlamys debaryana]
MTGPYPVEPPDPPPDPPPSGQGGRAAEAGATDWDAAWLSTALTRLASPGVDVDLTWVESGAWGDDPLDLGFCEVDGPGGEWLQALGAVGLEAVGTEPLQPQCSLEGAASHLPSAVASPAAAGAAEPPATGPEEAPLLDRAAAEVQAFTANPGGWLAAVSPGLGRKPHPQQQAAKQRVGLLLLGLQLRSPDESLPPVAEAALAEAWSGPAGWWPGAAEGPVLQVLRRRPDKMKPEHARRAPLPVRLGVDAEDREWWLVTTYSQRCAGCNRLYQHKVKPGTCRYAGHDFWKVSQLALALTPVEGGADAAAAPPVQPQPQAQPQAEAGLCAKRQSFRRPDGGIADLMVLMQPFASAWLTTEVVAGSAVLENGVEDAAGSGSGGDGRAAAGQGGPSPVAGDAGSGGPPPAKRPRQEPPPPWIESRDHVFGLLLSLASRPPDSLSAEALLLEWRALLSSVGREHLAAMRLPNGQCLAHWLATPPTHLDSASMQQQQPTEADADSPITQDVAVGLIEAAADAVGLQAWRQLLGCRDTSQGETPLHTAARFGHRLRVVAAMLHHANRSALRTETSSGRLPYEAAFRAGQRRAGELLLRAAEASPS